MLARIRCRCNLALPRQSIADSPFNADATSPQAPHHIKESIRSTTPIFTASNLRLWYRCQPRNLRQGISGPWLLAMYSAKKGRVGREEIWVEARRWAKQYLLTEPQDPHVFAPPSIPLPHLGHLSSWLRTAEVGRECILLFSFA